MPPRVSITSKRASVSRVNSAPLLICKGSLRRSWRCRKDTCTESMPPSSACSQLHSCARFDTKRCVGGTVAPFEIRRRRLVVRRSHIDPDHIAAFDTLIGGELDLLAEAAFDRLRRHLHALAGYVVFPAVIRTAQAVLFVAAEPQRHAAMRAELIHDADASEAVAEGDQPLAKEFHPHRRAVRFGNLG